MHGSLDTKRPHSTAVILAEQRKLNRSSKEEKKSEVRKGLPMVSKPPSIPPQGAQSLPMGKVPPHRERPPPPPPGLRLDMIPPLPPPREPVQSSPTPSSLATVPP